jgi:hypothetical protein
MRRVSSSAARTHRRLKHRLPALRALRDLDYKRFNRLLRKTLDTLPTDVTGPYWECSEANIAPLVVESDDPLVWQTFDQVVRRSVPGLRMELLNNLSRGDDSDAPRRLERLRFLARFLDDASGRQGTSGKFDGPCAGFLYFKKLNRCLRASPGRTPIIPGVPDEAVYPILSRAGALQLPAERISHPPTNLGPPLRFSVQFEVDFHSNYSRDL